jgi:hypothetical protein
VTDPRDEAPSEAALEPPEPAEPVEPAEPSEPAEQSEPAEPAESAEPRTVQYRGEPLDSERGPGLGCFRFQVVLLAAFIILTPLSVAWEWPFEVSAALLFATLLLLLVAGQTIIFLLRLVAADRRAAGRRRPLASQTKTVGELEDDEREGSERDDDGVRE